MVKDVEGAGAKFDGELARQQILNRSGSRTPGLNSNELNRLLSKNLEKAGVIPFGNVSSSKLLGMLKKGGSVVSHVDGNHWVQVMGSYTQGGKTWLKVYDPARGFYEQEIESFMVRTVSNVSENYMLHILPGS